MYEYKVEREKIFTDGGQRLFLSIRDRVKKLLTEAGAVRMQEAISGHAGDSWELMACIDRLVELGEIREIQQEHCAGQHRVFVN